MQTKDKLSISDWNTGYKQGLIKGRQSMKQRCLEALEEMQVRKELVDVGETDDFEIKNLRRTEYINRKQAIEAITKIQ